MIVTRALAALLAGAKMLEFLREHLFDGLAPAAMVGLLVSSVPRERPCPGSGGQ